MPNTNSIIYRSCLLLIAFLVYSGTSIFSKKTSTCKFLSVSYLLYFIGVIVSMGVYAILWQKILSFMPLNKAFLFKSVTLIMVLLISYFVFNETITTNNLIGASFVITGLVILAWKE